MMWKRITTVFLFAVIAVGMASAGGESEEKTGESATVSLGAGKFREAPMLAERVEAGELPPVEERLPPEPVMVQVAEEIGTYGGELKIGLAGTYSWYGDGQSAMGPETLLRLASDYSAIVPNIIRDHEFSNAGKTWTIHLIEGARWSDGDPFDADDLMFWYNDILLNQDLTPSGPAKR
jgi:peptide/nickel transport system substrate-binding protein